MQERRREGGEKRYRHDFMSILFLNIFLFNPKISSILRLNKISSIIHPAAVGITKENSSLHGTSTRVH
jgi:hypothetical protein